MTNAITNFLPQLAAHPDIRDLVQAHFDGQAAQVLQGMTNSSLGRDEAEQLEELISAFMDDHAEEVVSFRGVGGSPGNSSVAMVNLQTHHPQAAKLIQAQARELELLLGREQAAVALGQKREPFDIKVLCWVDICVVMADEFDNEWFDSKETAIAFAQSNYDPFIRNTKLSGVARQ